jgi:hypothetical protein
MFCRDGLLLVTYPVTIAQNANVGISGGQGLLNSRSAQMLPATDVRRNGTRPMRRPPTHTQARRCSTVWHSGRFTF